MADEIPGSPPKTTCFKVTQKLLNGGLICKVFTQDGAINAFSDLLVGVSSTAPKNVEVSSLDLVTSSVNLVEFFKTGGILFSTGDIK